MKNLRFMMAAIVAFTLAACSGGTPLDDTTELWPAGSDNGKTGYIDKAGNMVIEAKYQSASTFSCGYAVVYDANQVRLIKKNGEVQSTPSLSAISSFYYNYSTVYTSDNKCGLLNSKLKYAIEPEAGVRFSYMSNEGLVLKLTEGYYGYVNAKGEQIIAPKYEYALSFVDGVAAVYVDGKWGCINTDGQFVIQPTYEFLQPIGNERIIYLINGKFGLLDTQGVVKAQAEYDMVGNLNILSLSYVDSQIDLWTENWLPVMKDGKWGYIDKNGNVKLSLQYDAANMFRGGLAVVAQSDRYMVIDSKGNIKYLMGAEEHAVNGAYHNGLLLTISTKDSKYYYRDETGQVIYSWKSAVSYSPELPANNTIMGVPEPRELSPQDFYFVGKNLR